MFRARMSETLQVQQHKRAQHIQVHNNFYIFRSVFAIVRAPHLFSLSTCIHTLTRTIPVVHVAVVNLPRFATLLSAI